MPKHLKNMFATRQSICAKALLILITSFLIAGFFASANIAKAQDSGLAGAGGYDFRDFHADITINKDGSFDVVESIRGDFFEERHGLFRKIPYEYKRNDGRKLVTALKVTEVLAQGKASPHEIYNENGYRVIKIGSDDETLLGPFEYTIKYHVENALIFSKKFDEFYWNVTGDKWDVVQPDTVSTTVKLAGLKKEDVQMQCFTGREGSTESKCESTLLDGRIYVEASDYLTVKILLPLGLIDRPQGLAALIWWLKNNWPFLSFIIPVLVGWFVYKRWNIQGKDPKGRGTIIAEYEPPKGLTPTEVGALVDAKMHERDFSAAIVHLAVKGYLKIIEEKKDKLIFDKTIYKLKKLKDSDDNLKPFEKEIMDGLFSSSGEKEIVQNDTAMINLRKKVIREMYEEMANQELFVANPNKVRSNYLAIGIVVLMFGIFIGQVAFVTGYGPYVLIALILSAGVLMVFGWLMPKRTPKGVEALDKVLGFKEYLEKAEKYRIHWQEKEHIFEKFLPYAMVFGVADKWAKALETHEKSSPSWYSGPSGSSFSTSKLSAAVGSFAGAMSMASAPKSSSSSGGGGGGYSGGGFGGGGGGSW